MKLFLGIIVFLTMAALMTGIEGKLKKRKLKAAKKLNNRPIVGVLTMEMYDPEIIKQHPDLQNTSVVSASYVKFVEGAGAMAVPIFERSSEEELTRMFNKINGLVFPGSLISINHSSYATAARFLYNLALKANDRGDYFPIWGVCRGFQLFPFITVGGNPDDLFVFTPSSHNASLPIKFTEDRDQTRMLKNIPDEIVEAIESKPVTANFHEYSVTPEMFEKNEKLKERYRVLGTSKKGDEPRYVALFEDRLYPIYGFQFHPEKPLYEWDPYIEVDHGKETIRFSHYIAEFLMEEVRKNHHKFDSIEDENLHLMYNWSPVFTGKEAQVGSPFVQLYAL